jgi:nitrogen fixation protein FixH
MKRNPWPYAIILYFVVFIGAMATWIGFAVRNEQQLVRSDYYEQELKFQTEVDGQSRATGANVSIDYDSIKQTLAVVLPPTAATASVYFYRPSDARMDREITLALKDGSQSIDVKNFKSGLWKVRLKWIHDGAEYRHNATIVLAPTKLSTL